MNHFDDAKTHDLLDLASQISKSITSILDLENLLNSTLTLIYENFNCMSVSLHLLQDEKQRILSKISISDEGIEGPGQYVFIPDDDPVSRAITERETIVYKDDLEANDLSRIDPGIKSELAIPFRYGDQLLGILDLTSKSNDAFSEDKIAVLQLLSDQLAIAIRNARLYRLEQLKRQMTDDFLMEISNISVDHSVDAILDRILPILSDYIAYDVGVMWLLDQEQSKASDDGYPAALHLAGLHLTDQATMGNQNLEKINIDDIKQKLLELEDSQGLFTSYPWLTKLVSDESPTIPVLTDTGNPLGQFFFNNEAYSLISIPLYRDGQTLGIILLMNHQPYMYNKETILIAKGFGSLACVLINNSQLFSTAHDQAWMSTLLLQVSETYQSIDSMEELIESTAHMLTELVGVNACTLYLWDETLEAFYPQLSYGYDQEQQARLDEWEILKSSIDSFDRVRDEKQPVVLDYGNLPADIATLVLPSFDLASNLLILFPIFILDRVLGAVLIDFTGTMLEKDSPQKNWDDMFAVVQGILQQTALAIDNLVSNKSREEEAYISVALLQVAQAVVSLNDLEEILSSIVRITPILVGVKRCIIYLWDNTDFLFCPSQYYGFSKNDLQFEGHAFKSNEFPFIETTFKQNQISCYQLPGEYPPSNWSEITIPDIQILEGESAESDIQITSKLDTKVLREKARLLIGFPLAIRDDVLGVMLIEEEDPVKGSPSYHIREKRIEIVRGITQQAAMAIKNEQLLKEAVNSERMERELQLAREIQKTFLPNELPELPGWEIEVRWLPARQVAGDFYDILPMDGDHIGFVIADVADKGMPAALFMTLIRTLIRAAAKENSSPAAVLKQVNELLFRDSKNGMFVTVFYAVIDLVSGNVIYANAGHNPPILKSILNGELIELTRTSMALGIFYDIEVEESEVNLVSGDWLLCYTDGVTEAFSTDGEMYGVLRLFELLNHDHFQSPKEMVDRIDNSVRDFIKDADLSDDLTLAAIYRN